MHVLERLKERYGLDCTDADLDEIRDTAKAGKSFIVSRNETLLSERHLIPFKGTVIFAVVSSMTKTLLTVLPPNGSGNKPKKVIWRRAKPHHTGSRRKREGARPVEEFNREDWP